MVLSRTTMEVGQSVRVTGGDCLPAGRVQVSLGIGSSLSDVASTGNAVPAPDGTWAMTIQVSQANQLGNISAVGTCILPGGAAYDFSYPNVPIVVTTFRTVAIDPSTSVRPGTTLTITPHAGCPIPGAYAVGLASDTVHSAPSAGGPTDPQWQLGSIGRTSKVDPQRHLHG